jgi:hypothetical protein
MRTPSSLGGFSRKFCLLASVGIALVGSAPVTPAAQSQFDQFKNYGLVGVGRIPADTFDRLGDGHQDTLGGLFSSVEAVSTFALLNGKILLGELLAQPDRGFGNGDFDIIPGPNRSSI